MKKVLLTMSVIGAVTLTSCKKETTVLTEETPKDTVVVIDEELKPNNEIQSKIDQAKIRLDQAEKDLIAAKARGDKKAEELAQKAVNESQDAWESLQKETSEAIREAKDDINSANQKAKEKIKEAETKIENTKDEVVKDVKEASKETKKEIEKASDKIKSNF